VVFSTGQPLVGINEHRQSTTGNVTASPSPFRSSTSIHYALLVPSVVHLSIHDQTGRKIKVLVDCKQAKGHHSAEWNGKDSKGNVVPNGSYYYILKTKDTEYRYKIVKL
jgi:flagellar hook assembly protein FlgD